MRKGKKSIATAVSHLPAASCLTASAENSENPLKISVESSRESHLVRVNEPFEFIIHGWGSCFAKIYRYSAS